MTRIVTDAFFLESASGARCFGVLYRPAGGIRGVLVHVPAFAEEMNKSRRMVALAGRAFAADGWATLVLDLGGCGDSSGDMQDFAWDDWLKDIDAAVRWAETQTGGPLVLWGLRAGCLLICDWLRTRARSLPVLFWQPVVNGKQHLTQFLRIKAAAEMLTEADARGSVAALRSRLDAGECVEVAGYTLCAPLAAGLTASTLKLDDAHRHPISIVELGGSGGDLSPALSRSVEHWSGSGLVCKSQAVEGPAFWSTTDIMTAPEMLDASREAMAGLLPC
ncbi:hydrolase 2, exosortase A system-associated [Rhodocyclaceae bacterium SMB388]